MTRRQLPTAKLAAGLRRVAELAAAERHLAVLVTTRGERDPSVCIVNVGQLDHPVSGEPVLAFVSRGGTAKLANLRRAPREIYLAAGGAHPDLDEYDRVMAAERRTAVLLRPIRFSSNPAGTDHEEPR